MTRAADVYAKLTGKPHANGYLVPCVAHEDRNPSLSISDGDKGLVWYCHKGCTQDAVRDGLERAGFDVKGEPRDLERRAEIVWQIADADGKVIAQHVRVDKPEGKIVFWRGPKGEKVGPDGQKWKLPVKLHEMPLYGSELLAYSEADAPVVICEGEKSADAARKLKLVALGTVTGASNAPGDEALSILKDRRVYVWPDNDEPGRQHAAKIMQRLARLGIKAQLVTWPAAPPKGDAADFVAMGKTRADFEALLAPPPPAADTKAPARPKLKLLHEGVKDAMRELDRYTAGDFSDRVPTGIEELDRLLNGGLRHGQVTLIGAVTGGGKSTLGQRVAAHAAATRGSVLFVSPEMGVDELAEREIIRVSGRRKWDRNPWDKWGAAVARRDAAVEDHNRAASKILTEKLPIYVLDETATMLDVEDHARELVKQKLALIVLDYAQELADDDPRKPRNIQVAEVARSSVQLAKRYRVPILVASQVNVQELKGKKGATGGKEYNFRETAVLEQKAHTVLVLEVDRVMEGGRSRIEAARVICKKQRGGGTFIQPVHYDPAVYEITDKLPPSKLAAGQAKDSEQLSLDPPETPR